MFSTRPLRVVQEIGIVFTKVPQVIPCHEAQNIRTKVEPEGTTFVTSVPIKITQDNGEDEKHREQSTLMIKVLVGS